MNNKFLFVNLAVNTASTSNRNHGLAYLSPQIKKKGFEVDCLTIERHLSARQFLRHIDKADPAIIGFSSTSHQLKFLAEYSNVLNAFPSIRQVAGGVGATLEPEWILQKSLVQGVCLGEGEFAIQELLDRIQSGADITQTPGFYWRLDGGIKKNAILPFARDLDFFDFPDYTLFKGKEITKDGNLWIRLGRGCPYSCHYCCNKALRSVYPSQRGYFRIPSVEYSIALVETMVKNFPHTNMINFEDDLMIANQEWFASFAGEYGRRIGIPYRVNARVECISRNSVTALANSGCKEVFVGVESGNEYLRHHVLNRHYSNKLLCETCEWLKQAGMEIFTFNMVGLPFESEEALHDTLQINKKIAPHKGTCTFFYPYKGTELHRLCEQQGLLKSEEDMRTITNYSTRPSIRMSKRQERACQMVRRQLIRYLKRQEYMTRMSRLQGTGARARLAITYRIRMIFKTMPLLDKFKRMIIQFFSPP